MEPKYYTIATAFLLVVLLLDLPNISTGRSLERSRGESEDRLTEEVYEIDYRGPETHPVLPFPSRGRPRFRPEHPNSKPPPQITGSKVDKVRG